MTSDPRWRENQKVAQAAMSSANELVPALAEIVRTGNWREFIHPMQGLKCYDTFTAYCDDFLGLTADAVEALLDGSMFKSDAIEVRKLIRQGIKPNPRNGELGNGRSGDTKPTPIPNDDNTYLIARLKRDDPALAQQVVDGEITPNAAAIEAGYRKRYVRCRADSPDLAVRSLLNHYTREQLLAALHREEMK